MATVSKSRLERLPNELLLQILAYLEPFPIAQLQLVSRHFRKLCLDDTFWRARCFDESVFLTTLRWRRQIVQPLVSPDSSRYVETDNDVVAVESPDTISVLPIRSRRASEGDGVRSKPEAEAEAEADEQALAYKQRIQDMANWDPVFPGERVSWYDEYIHRNGHMNVSWLQQPKIKVGADDWDVIDVRGVALFREDAAHPKGPLMAVSPMDDGSVCLWDVNGARGRKGAVVARSKPDVLFLDGSNVDHSLRSKRVDTGVTECVSVNHHLRKAFLAVQSHLLELDLNRLEVVDYHPFPWSITGLSSAEPGVPLTVGTNGGLHLYDYRERAKMAPPMDERVDGEALKIDPFRIIFDSRPLPPYSHAQPSAISVIHMPQPGSPSLVSNDLYVAGRFTNIAHYDRRQFPKMIGSIYSGARLSCLACLPYPFSALDVDLRRKGLLSSKQVARSKDIANGRTLIAAGEYNSKGSLEMYNLRTEGADGSRLTSAIQKNRQTSAASKLLSVANHGTCIVCSDGQGNIKWFERDGYTQVRQLRLGYGEVPRQPSVFASMPGSDDLARKVVSTASGLESNAAADADEAAGHNNDDLLFWTGDKLGLVEFTTNGFTSEDFDETRAVDSDGVREKEKKYREAMREALSKQADEVRFVRDLGLGAIRTE